MVPNNNDRIVTAKIRVAKLEMLISLNKELRKKILADPATRTFVNGSSYLKTDVVLKALREAREAVSAELKL
jgi:hypothetical protein